MKLLSWNVNGIRAAQKKGFLEWMTRESPDIVCIQETKARPEQLEVALLEPKGYKAWWSSAEKPGYSGVGIYSRVEPLQVIEGLGVREFDSEGRVQVAEFENFTLINAYFPNSQREHARLPYKLRFCKKIAETCESLRKKGRNVVLCGDYNISHKPIDLANPKQNEKNAGYLPEERDWMENFISKLGYIDTFRNFESGPGHYTWWSNRPGVRDRNIGWRLDYFCVNPEFKNKLKKTWHQPQVKGSDHCPVGLELF